MRLTPKETEKLMLHCAGELAKDRKNRQYTVPAKRFFVFGTFLYDQSRTYQHRDYGFWKMVSWKHLLFCTFWLSAGSWTAAVHQGRWGKTTKRH